MNKTVFIINVNNIGLLSPSAITILNKSVGIINHRALDLSAFNPAYVSGNNSPLNLSTGDYVALRNNGDHEVINLLVNDDAKNGLYHVSETKALVTVTGVAERAVNRTGGVFIAEIQNSDDDPYAISKDIGGGGDYLTFKFPNLGIPPNTTIVSVIVTIEHHETDDTINSTGCNGDPTVQRPDDIDVWNGTSWSWVEDYSLSTTDINYTSSDLGGWINTTNLANDIRIQMYYDKLGDTGDTLYVDYAKVEVTYLGNRSAGPCFFDRLEGNLNLSEKYINQSKAVAVELGLDPNNVEIGLESFIDVLEFENRSIFKKHILPLPTTQSILDYQFFQNISGKGVYGTPNSFRIDDGHKHKYNLTDFII